MPCKSVSECKYIINFSIYIISHAFVTKFLFFLHTGKRYASYGTDGQQKCWGIIRTLKGICLAEVFARRLMLCKNARLRFRYNYFCIQNISEEFYCCEYYNEICLTAVQFQFIIPCLP